MLGVILTGCVRDGVYLLDQDEVVVLDKGQSFLAPYEGVFYSRRAEEAIMKYNAKKLKSLK